MSGLVGVGDRLAFRHDFPQGGRLRAYSEMPDLTIHCLRVTPPPDGSSGGSRFSLGRPPSQLCGAGFPLPVQLAL